MIDLAASDWPSLMSDPEFRNRLERSEQPPSAPRRRCWKCLWNGIGISLITWFGFLVDGYSQPVAAFWGMAALAVTLLLFRGWAPPARHLRLERWLFPAIARKAGLFFVDYTSAGAVRSVAPFLFGDVGNVRGEDLVGQADGSALRCSTYHATGKVKKRIYSVGRGDRVETADDEEDDEPGPGRFGLRGEPSEVVVILSRGLPFDLLAGSHQFDRVTIDPGPLDDAFDIYATAPGYARALIADPRLRSLLLEMAGEGELRFYADPLKAVVAGPDAVAQAARRTRGLPVEARARALAAAFRDCLIRLAALTELLGGRPGEAASALPAGEVPDGAPPASAGGGESWPIQRSGTGSKTSPGRARRTAERRACCPHTRLSRGRDLVDQRWSTGT